MIELHPRNTQFKWRPLRGPFSALTESQARQFDADGYFRLKSAFSVADLRDVEAAIDPFEEALEGRLRTEKPGRRSVAKPDAITFTTHLVAKSMRLKAFSKHPVLRGLCRDIIGPRARLFWDQAVYKKPGNPEEFPWHQDNGYTFVEPQQYLTCWIPLRNATVQNGCPWVVPGLHRQGTLRHHLTKLGWQCLEAPANAVAVEAAVGDIVVFSSLTPHRTGPNLTDDVRKAYILQYAPDGVVAYDPSTNEEKRQDDPLRQYFIEGGHEELH